MKLAISRRHLLRLGAASCAGGLAAPFVRRAAHADTQQAQLSAADKADVARIEQYLNGLGSVKASWIPAIRLRSAGCAAAPTARPARPAEAIRVTPISRTLGIVSSIMQKAMTRTMLTPTR